MGPDREGGVGPASPRPHRRPAQGTGWDRSPDARDSLQALQHVIGNRAMASLLRQPTPAAQQPVSPPKKLPGGLRVVIVGHASPRWKQAKRPQDADSKNRELSEQRTEEVRQIVDLRLQSLLGPNVPITYVYYG